MNVNTPLPDSAKKGCNSPKTLDADATKLDCKSLGQSITGRTMSSQCGQSAVTPVLQPVQAREEEELGVTSAEQLKATTRKRKSDASQPIPAENPEPSIPNKGKKHKAVDSGIEPRKAIKHSPSSLTIIDNFCTPANRTFYERSPYSQLNILKQEIRLIKLLPTKDNEPLEVNLISGCFLDPNLLNHSYCAISYCAGDPKNTEQIKVNGLDFNAFASLGLALRQVLRAKSRGGLRGCPDLIWTDQICINQSDPRERSQQVSLMKKIFRTATQVLASLGEDNNKGLWLKMMIQLCQIIKVPGTPRLFNEIPPIRFKGTTVWVGDRFLDDCQTPLFQAKCKAFLEIITHPWWSRGWIYQEVIVSQKSTLLIGHESANLDHFTKATEVAFEIFATQLRATKENPDLLDEHASSIIIAAIRGLYSLEVISLVESRAKWATEQVLDLKELLEHSRRCKVSDYRDSVFAFIGLADPGYSIMPDYTVDLEATFRQTCKRIILYERSLRILCHSQERERHLTLPSWVPDWSSEERGNPLATEIHFRASSEYPSAAAFDSNEPEKPNSILRVQCLVVDQVAGENGMGCVPWLNRPTGMIWGIFEDWARVAGGDEMLELVRAVALSDDIDEENKTTGEEDEESDSDFVKPGSMYFNGESLIDAFFGCLLRGRDRAGEIQQDRMVISTSMEGDRVFFKSPKGYMGLADSRALATDCICVLLGAPVPFILRRLGNHYMLIGEAYVHGFMYGEAIEMMRRGDLEVKTISIY